MNLIAFEAFRWKIVPTVNTPRSLEVTMLQKSEFQHILNKIICILEIWPTKKKFKTKRFPN